MRKFYLLMFICFFITSILNAHEHKKTNQDSTTLKHSQEISDSTTHTATKAGKVEGKQAHYKIIVLHEIFEHLHNKLVHFPIAFVAAGFIFTLFNLRRQVFDKTILILAIMAGLFSVAAFFSGNIQASAFAATDKEWLVGIHKNFGIATIITTWTWIVFLLIKPLQKYAWIISLIAVFLVLLTGFYGGIIAH